MNTGTFSAEANAAFERLNPFVTNRDMARSAVEQLKEIETGLQINVDAYIAENGGEEAIEEEIKDGQHEKLSRARFKLELVRTTKLRFQSMLDQGKAAVDEFIKV